MATITQAQAGNWSDPGTWDAGVPGADDDVILNAPIVLDINDPTTRLGNITGQVGAVLSTDPSVDVAINVDTIVNMGLTEIEVTDPNRTLDIIFRSDRDLNVAQDAAGRGFRAMGQAKIQGAEKTPYATVRAPVAAGESSIQPLALPPDWEVGDLVSVAGTRRIGYRWDGSDTVFQGTETEYFRIVGLAGGTIFLDGSFQHDHFVADNVINVRSDAVYAINNLTRNITFRSEDAENTLVHRRGHTMFSGAKNHVIQNSAFWYLGRTRKDEITWDGVSQITATTNLPGRYPIHLHPMDEQNGQAGQRDPFDLIQGCAVFDSPGWAITQHGRKAAIVKNAVSRSLGAGIVSEAGNEIGPWDANCVMDMSGEQGPTRPGRLIGKDDQFFAGGYAYAMRSRMIDNTDNLAFDCAIGYLFNVRATQGRSEPTHVIFNVPNYKLEQVCNYRPNLVNVADDGNRDGFVGNIGWHPIKVFDNNQVGAADWGFALYKSNTIQLTENPSIQKNLLAWEVEHGAEWQYSGRYIVENFDVFGMVPHLNKKADDGLLVDKDVISFAFKDNRITGFDVGARMPFKKGSVALNEDVDTNEDWSRFLIGTTFVNNDENITTETDDPNLLNVLASTPPIVPLNIDYDPASLCWSNGQDLVLSGTYTDTLGTVPYPRGAETFALRNKEVLFHLEKEGYFTEGGSSFFIFPHFLFDRCTGEKHLVELAIEMKGNIMPEWKDKGPLDRSKLFDFRSEATNLPVKPVVAA